MGSAKWNLAKGTGLSQGKAVLTFDAVDDNDKTEVKVIVDLSEEDVVSLEQAFKFARGFFKGTFRDFISGRLKK